MTSPEKSQLVHAAIEKLYVDWAFLRPQETLLKLGSRFEAAVWQLLENRDQHRAKLEAYFQEVDPTTLIAFATDPDFKKAENRQDDLNLLLKAGFEALKPYNEYMRIALGLHPEYLPDYKMWGLRDSYEAKELKWLSIGFEPTNDLINGRAHDFGYKAKQVDPVVVKEAERRHEIIARSVTLKLGNRRRATGDLALEWLNSIELDVPEGFRTMLRTSAGRLSNIETPGIEGENNKNDLMDPRALRAASRVIAAMAIDCYGWQAEDKRGPIPGELEAICDRLGLSVSRETILKYLRTGAAQLPQK